MAALPLPKALRVPGEQATPGATSCWPPVTPGQPWGFHAESLVGSVSTHAHPYRASACPEVQGPLWGFSPSRGTGPPTGLQCVQRYRVPMAHLSRYTLGPTGHGQPRRGAAARHAESGTLPASLSTPCWQWVQSSPSPELSAPLTRCILQAHQKGP